VDLITVRRGAGPVFEIRVRGHSVRCSRAGGEAGPTPVELLAGSLGACIAMAVQDRCDRRGHGDGEVRVDLALEMADGPRRVAGIVADVTIPRDVPGEEADRVRRVARGCVVHETLAHPPQVDVDIV
jgi:putative redox protein